MYPGMAKTARDEGFEELAEWFETLAKAEKSHANRFTKGLDSAEKRLSSAKDPRREGFLVSCLGFGARVLFLISYTRRKFCENF